MALKLFDRERVDVLKADIAQSKLHIWRNRQQGRVMYLEDIAHKRENPKMDLWTFGQ